MIKCLFAGVLALMFMLAQPVLSQETTKPKLPTQAKEMEMRLIIRTDDIGFCHAANAAAERILNNGVVTAMSVMVTTPWLDEAVEILRKHPEVSVGVHTALNSEWMPYRWGPVTPWREVPSLVDAWGKFFGTRAELMAHNPSVDEVEKEVRAQIELAFSKGLNPCYVDHHMSAAVNTPAMRERLEKLALEYHLGISRYFGEKNVPSIYATPPEQKVAELEKHLSELNEPGLYLLVVHPGLDQPEMAVLRDQNATGLKDMVKHRQAETEMLCNPDIKRLIKKRGILLVGYKEVIAEQGLGSMKRPEEQP
jgi:predicted glycoside hydrolase/deacetylase ChbG (UPF0249 family)